MFTASDVEPTSDDTIIPIKSLIPPTWCAELARFRLAERFAIVARACLERPGCAGIVFMPELIPFPHPPWRAWVQTRLFRTLGVWINEIPSVKRGFEVEARGLTFVACSMGAYVVLHRWVHMIDI